MRSALFLLIILIIVSCVSGRMYRNTKFSDIRSGRNLENTNNYITGECSYYAHKFHGRKTANGEIFDMYALTAAHKKLPFGTILEVENLANNKKVTVRINDRGPFVSNRILDLSYAAAEKIEMLQTGTAHIRAKIISQPN